MKRTVVINTGVIGGYEKELIDELSLFYVNPHNMIMTIKPLCLMVVGKNLLLLNL